VSKSTSPDTPRPNNGRLRFPKSARLRNSGDFTRVRDQGKASQTRLLRVGILRSDDAFTARIGIITSRRVGGAVIRSKVRRRLREIVRLCRETMSPGASVVIVAKSGASTATFEELKSEWLLLARRLSILPSAE